MERLFNLLGKVIMGCSADPTLFSPSKDLLPFLQKCGGGGGRGGSESGSCLRFWRFSKQNLTIFIVINFVELLFSSVL